MWQYYLWPIRIPTPRWFDNNHGQRHQPRIEAAWCWMRGHALIRLRRVT